MLRWFRMDGHILEPIRSLCSVVTGEGTGNCNGFVDLKKSMKDEGKNHRFTGPAGLVK